MNPDKIGMHFRYKNISNFPLFDPFKYSYLHMLHMLHNIEYV